MSSPTKRLRKHSQEDFLSLMIAAKRLPTSSFENLTDLNLSNLQLIRIDSFPFDKLSRLISLNLSFNQLVSIEANWSKGEKISIEKLNLSHNKLETLVFLQDFHSLKSIDVTENLFRVNERFLLFSISSNLENLIDANRDQLDDEQLKYDQFCQLIETKIDRLWATSYHEKYRQELRNPSVAKKLLDDFRQSMLKILCKQPNFSQIHLSPLANIFLTKKIDELSSSSSAPVASRRSTFKTHLTSEFTQLMDKNKTNFQAKIFLRTHHQTESNLLTTPVRMCAFEPNSTDSILATCGGQKLCFIDCSTGEVTHLYQVPILRSTATPFGRKFKEKTSTNIGEYFSSLCWVEINLNDEIVKIVAVAATNGHVYLVSPKFKVMFGHLEIANASISCLTWNSTNPSQLIVASFQTVRFINIQSYFDRLRQFIVKQNKSSETIDFALTTEKLSMTEIYHLDHPDGSTTFTITDLLIYPKKSSMILVATTAGLFLIENRTTTKFDFPKSMCTVGENIESLAWIDERSGEFAMNILGYDQICSIDLEQSLVQKQLIVLFQFVNPSRQIACRMSIVRFVNENDSAEKSFECVLGQDNGSIVHHRIRLGSTTMKKSKKIQFDDQRTDISCSIDQKSTILSTSLNERYLCFTTTNNLICIYEREQC